MVRHIIKPLLKKFGALCYQTTKKWWGTCPLAPPMVTTLLIIFETEGDLNLCYVSATLTPSLREIDTTGILQKTFSIAIF